MGVHGLWTLLEPVGKPVPLESLENKILAVDVSIWLHQATKGFRDAHGNPLPNAHLLGLCHRLCKLLFYKIKPIFVFDGGVPALKRQTIAARQSRRNVSAQNNNKIAEKILANYLKSEMINQELGGKGKGKSLLPRKRQEPDLFELPPQASDNLQESESESESSDEFEEVDDFNPISAQLQGHNIHSVDVTSAEFISLPPEVQHEILLELRDTRKQSSWNKIDQMPQEATDFSSFQMERLLKRRNLQQRLNEVEKEISRKKHATFDMEADDEVMTQSIVSDSSKHYVLIKKALEKKEISPTKKEENDRKSPLSVVNFLPEDSNIGVDDFTQEEILAIMKSEGGGRKETQEHNVVHFISSSEDDSDLEEVPIAPQQPNVILSVPINPEELPSDEDMFADIFGDMPVAGQTCATITSSTDEETSCEAKSFTSIRDPQVRKSQTEIEILESSSIQHKDQGRSLSPTICTPENVLSKVVVSAGNTENGFEETKEVKLFETLPTDLVAPGYSVANVIGCESNKETPVVELNSFGEIHDERPIRKDSICVPENEKATSEALLACRDLKAGAEIVPSLVREDAEVVQAIDASADHVPSNTDSSSTSQTQNTLSVEKNAEEPSTPPQALDGAYREKLEEMDRILYEEQFMLVKERGRQERMATSLTDQIYAESQEMLRYFGIPYLVAPMEAEAQCAYLDEIGMTQGTITDDSDIWLFGGRRVYKNFFNQSKYVEYFEMEDIHKVFKMKRQQLVSLALLTGSDYTEGLQGVGPVFALEIMGEFPGEGLEQLENFKEWLTRVQKAKAAPPGNKIRQKIRNIQLIPGFPSRAVVDAYINPEVNTSREKFSWVEPDLSALRDYLQEKIGWNREKFSSVVLPVLERFKNKEYQTRIDSFFAPRFSSGPKAQNISKRVLNAISKADFQSSPYDGAPVETLENVKQTTKNTKKRRSDGAESSGVKRNKKATVPKPTGTQATASSSGNSGQVGEKIWQREKDRQVLEMNKLKAIETFKKSRGRGGKRLPRRAPLPEARLSDSDSSSP